MYNYIRLEQALVLGFLFSLDLSNIAKEMKKDFQKEICWRSAQISVFFEVFTFWVEFQCISVLYA